MGSETEVLPIVEMKSGFHEWKSMEYEHQLRKGMMGGGMGVGGSGAPSLPVLHLSLESLSQMQELYYSYEDCLRNAYSM